MNSLILTVLMMLFNLYSVTPVNHAQAVTVQVAHGVPSYTSTQSEVRAPITQTVRSNRSILKFDTTASSTSYIRTWEGGESLDHNDFVGTVSTVVKKLPFISNNKNVVKLVLETAAIESDFGLNISPKSRSKGVFQFHLSTVRYLEQEVFKNRPELADAVHQFYDKRHSLTWNVRYNLPYQTALTLVYYHLRVGDDLDSKITNQSQRFQVYKKFFNTPRGASTKKTYQEKANNYVDYVALGTQVQFT